MISRRLAAWRKVVALAPLLLLVVAAVPGEILVRCQMDGLARSSCCCPPETEAPAPSLPAVKTQGCCDREVTVNQPSVAESARTPAVDFVAATLLALESPVSLAADDAGGARPAPGSHGPPRDGPSIVLLKQSFLI